MKGHFTYDNDHALFLLETNLFKLLLSPRTGMQIVHVCSLRKTKFRYKWVVQLGNNRTITI